MSNQNCKQKNITTWEQVPVIFDVPMAARLLGMSDQMIRQMCRKGKIPAYKIGENSWRFNKGDFMEHLGIIKR
ncbi:MAG: helix-turn-helix domain-containing protein [Ruminiclostridium sp.]